MSMKDWNLQANEEHAQQKAENMNPYTDAEEKAADACISVANYLMLYHSLRWANINNDLNKLRLV